jgi:hypothetical protein
MVKPVTEAEWVACDDPDEMFRFLLRTRRASDRKLRLFAVACCRQMWDRITERRSRHAVETSERYADDRATDEQLEAGFLAADRAFSEPLRARSLRVWDGLDAARLAAHPEMRGLADGTAYAAASAGVELGTDYWGHPARRKVMQCALCATSSAILSAHRHHCLPPA